MSPVAQSDYNQLPANVQAQIKNIGGNAFSIQQLLFDFTTATMHYSPIIQNLSTTSYIYLCLEGYFVQQYFKGLIQNGQPMLGCAIIPSAATGTLTLTNFEMQVDPYVGDATQQDFYTLNFLCAANNNPLPAPAAFNWNWIDAAPVSPTPPPNGAVAVKSTSFINWLANLLSPPLNIACPTAQCNCGISGGDMNYMIELNPNATPQQYTILTVEPAYEGFIHALTFTYNSVPPVSHGGSTWYLLWGSLGCTYTFISDVYIGNNAAGTNGQIKIVNEIVVNLAFDLEHTYTSGNFADYSATMVFDMGVGPFGNLNAAIEPYTVVDTSEPPDPSWVQSDLTAGAAKSCIDTAQAGVQDAIQAFMTDLNNAMKLDLLNPQSFVFPGGKTFVFKDALFSTVGDLVAHITYVNP
jgi:hypothetical protein